METPKHLIIDIQFSPVGNKLFFVVKKENYPKKTDNGLASLMTQLNAETTTTETKTPVDTDVRWFMLSDSLDRNDILSIKWTPTLLLGTALAGAVLVKVGRYRSHS